MTALVKEDEVMFAGKVRVYSVSISFSCDDFYFLYAEQQIGARFEILAAM